jgi:hypothetical protein
MRIKRLLIAAGVSFLVLSTLVLSPFGSAVLSQVSVALRTVLAQNDLIQIIPNGQPSAQSQYATLPRVTNVTGYYTSTPLTGFSYQFAGGITNAAFTPAGTLASGYVTLASTPSDGAVNCVFSSTAITQFNVCTASTGIGNCTTTGIVGGITTLAANGTACYFFKGSGVASGTWYRMR